MADNRTVVLLVGAFMALIVGVSLLTVSATEEQKVVVFTNVVNESVDNSPSRAVVGAGLIDSAITTDVAVAYTGADGWKSGETECEMTNVALRNNTIALTLDTDYTFSDGTITWMPTALTNSSGNTTFTTYSYCPDTYITQSWGRSTLDVAIGFFAIALLVISLGLFYAIMRKEGLLNI